MEKDKLTERNILQGMAVTARPVEPRKNLYGFASVTIGGITIDDFKIAADRDGILFVGMPSKRDETSRNGYRNTVRIAPEIRDEFSAIVLSAHHNAVEALMEKAEKNRIADQMEQAGKEAKTHNAGKPAKEKGAESHENRG